MIYIFLKVILRGFKNHWAKKNNKSVRKKKKILYREDKLGWKNAQIAQSAFQGSLSLLYYLQLLKRWDRESCFLLSPGCIYWWASWDRIWNCGCEGTLGLCPWVGRSRREQQGPCRAQSWCVWAFCATEGQLSRRGWGQTAALGTQCSVTGRVCGRHTGCMQWPGAAWQPAQDPCSAGSAQGEERGRGAQSRVTAGTWLSWLGQWNPSLLCNQVQVHTTAAHSFIFSPFSTEVLQKFLLINANYLFPLEFREKQGEPENLIEQCQKQQSSDPVLWDKQRRRGKGAWDHGARGHLLLPQPSLPPRFGESCRVQHEKKKKQVWKNWSLFLALSVPCLFPSSS